jgi:hypothetical protein
MAIQLAASEPEPQSGPEELLISALIESGTYEPKKYRVVDSAIRAKRTVHEFCLAYQRTSGEAPPVHLIESKFPSFTFTSGISPTWAAGEVMKAETNREMRKLYSQLGMAIKDEAHGEAISLMNEAMRAYRTGNAEGVDALDFELLEKQAINSVVSVPGQYLTSLTGGHGAGELWLVAAMWGVGKSWRLLEHAVSALEDGWNVMFFSLEMNPAGILKRLHSIALRNVPNASLMSEDERKTHLSEWYERCGEFKVFGPDAGRVDATVIAGAVTDSKTLIIVDYVGRMYTTSGQPARDDWSKVSLISQELVETAGMLEVPILAAVQLNRQGNVAGSMDLERDCTLMVEISRLSEHCNRARKNTIKKSRNTDSLGVWYSAFDAVNGRFGDISSEQALEIRLEDEAEAL